MAPDPDVLPTSAEPVARARLDPDEIAAHGFTRARKGYEADEVRAYLVGLASQWREATRVADDMKRRLAELERRAADPRDLDVATINELVGEETARVLEAARVAAQDMRANARSDADALTAEATASAASVRADADDYDASTRASADEYTARLRAQADADAAEQRDAALVEVTEQRARADTYAADTRSAVDLEVAELRRTTEAETADMRGAAEAVLAERTTEAEVEAARVRADAEAHAGQVRDDADRHRDETRAGADTYAAGRRSEADAYLEQTTADADRLRAEADADIDAKRADVEADLAAMRSRSETEAETVVADARGEGRTMVQEARTYRERVIVDLAERRRVGQSEIERLASTRDALAVTLTDVVHHIDASHRMLQDLAIDAGRRADPDEDRLALDPPSPPPAPAGPPDEAGSELAGPPEDGATAAEPAAPDESATAVESAAPDDAAPGAADVGRGLDGEPTVDGSTVDEPTAVDEPAAEEPSDDLDSGHGDAATSPGELEDPVAVMPVEVAPATASPSSDEGPDQSPGAGGAPADEHVSAADVDHEADSTGTVPGATEGDGSPGVDAVMDGEVVPPPLVEAAVDDDSPEEAPPADASEGAGAAEDIFARLRAGQAEGDAGAVGDDAPAGSAGAGGADSAAVDDAGPDHAEPDEPADADAAEAEAEADLAEPEADDDDSDDDSDLLDLRDASTDEVERQLARRLKRVLSDEQNEALDLLRRTRGTPTADAVIPSEAGHLGRYAAAAREDLAAAERAGAGFFGDPPARTADVDDIAATIAADLVRQIRGRLERAFEDGGDEQEIGERIRACYREWKTQRIADASRHHVLVAFSRGVAEAADGATSFRWLVDDGDAPCPDCDDNALAGPTSRGEPFPTGDLCPPAHPGCRCLAVPVS